MIKMKKVPVSTRAAAEIVSSFQSAKLENVITAAFILIRIVNYSFFNTTLGARIARMSLPGTANLRCFFYLLIVAALILALVNDLILAADLFSFEKRALVATRIPRNLVIGSISVKRI